MAMTTLYARQEKKTQMCITDFWTQRERKRVFAMTSAFTWQKSVSLCPASFCIPRPNLPVTPGVSCCLLEKCKSKPQ